MAIASPLFAEDCKHKLEEEALWAKFVLELVLSTIFSDDLTLKKLHDSEVEQLLGPSAVLLVFQRYQEAMKRVCRCIATLKSKMSSAKLVQEAYDCLIMYSLYVCTLTQRA